VLRGQWERLPSERGERAALVALVALLLAGGGLRLWLTLSQRPALIGYTDTYDYLFTASGMRPLFEDGLRPAGYPLFLRIANWVNGNLSFTILLQHGLGLASALLLYLAARRVGVPRWWALLPAGVVALGGPQILIEHAPLTESLFVFFQSAAVYLATRAADAEKRGLAWALTAGLLVGMVATVRTLGLLLMGALAVWFVLASPGSWRARLLRGGASVGAAVVVLGAYVFIQEAETGYTGLTRAGTWVMYGRTGPFADCDRFKPPKGTRALCEDTPADERPGPNSYMLSPESPAVRVLGGPYVATREENERLGDFARAALLNQPLDWLDDIVTYDLPRYVSSDDAGRENQGQSFDELQLNLIDGPLAPYAANVIRAWYSTPGQHLNQGQFDSFLSYERATRVVGPFFVVLALLALAGLILARSDLRSGAWLFTLVALVSILGPPAALAYDARYAIPAFGPLAAAAAVGGAAITARILAWRAGRSTATASV
jgi:Dolichyl-phosphate-mannose-protein mannosyltransferase